MQARPRLLIVSNTIMDECAMMTLLRTSLCDIEIMGVEIAPPVRAYSCPPRVPTNAVADSFPILVTRKALSKLENHAQSDPRREIAGVLIGQVYTCGHVSWLDVDDVIPTTYGQNGATYVTITCDDWRNIDLLLQTDFHDRRIVGWYHSHPGLGTFLSGADLFIHRVLFDLWWHVAIVVDPIRSDLRVFRWHGGSMVPGTLKMIGG